MKKLMTVKRILSIACVMLAMFASVAFAQGRTLYVARDGSAQYTSIQMAINDARQGDIVEILDAETYNEQVTIDSTKHGLTLRSSKPTSLVKPVIRWLDTVNQGPRTYQESLNDELSGQFERCGALRVIYARGVVIDGITVDGVKAAPFAWGAVWGQRDSHFHGNAAIALAIAGNVTIRNCEMRNAYFGVTVKDRNPGGAFGNANQADNDVTIPLSRFGRTGNHLIEHNRVHSNSVGFFFESVWDLGSTVRYNLIYSNYHRGMPVDASGKLTIAAMANAGSVGTKVEPVNPTHGAFVFKDILYTPIAIYNNTLYDNNHHFMADWKTGAPHIIFNNIFARQHSDKITAAGGMELDNNFPNRMNNNTFSATNGIQIQRQRTDFIPLIIFNEAGYRNTTGSCSPVSYTMTWVGSVQMANSFPAPMSGTNNVTEVFSTHCEGTWPESFIPLIETPVEVDYEETARKNGVLPGAILSAAGGLPASAENRWLEVVGGLYVSSYNDSLMLPNYVLSTSPTSPDFLRPKWDDPIVTQYIKNMGWQHSNGSVVRNSNGSNADLGAIPSTGRAQPVVARILPTSVVYVNGINANANFNLLVEGGQFNNPEITFLRWVTLPAYPDDPYESSVLWGSSSAIPVPSNSITVLPPDAQPGGASVAVGANSKSFTLPAELTANQKYGFFEIIVEGTDANGNKVTSDIGFLPYRQLNHFLDIQVLEGGSVVENPVVTAGEPVTIMVTAMERGADGELVAFNADGNIRPLETNYSLMSDPAARMWQQIDPVGNPLTADDDLKTDGIYTKTYTVYFSKAGNETINGAGIWTDGSSYLAFQGTLNLTVHPAPPAFVTFIDPIPKADLGESLPSVITPGTDRSVMAMVTDKFGNPVNTSVPVYMRSESPSVGDFVLAGGSLANGTTVTANADPVNGIVVFSARVTNGEVNDVFDLTATITTFGDGTATDVGSLRVGVNDDVLKVFYTQPTGNEWRDDYDAVEEINGMGGDWVPVWIQAVSGDIVKTNKNADVCVTVSENLLVSLDPSDIGAATSILGTLTNGVLKVYVSVAPGAPSRVVNGSLHPVAVRDQCGGILDNSIGNNKRDNINFINMSSSISYGAVFAEKNGVGRPDRVEIVYSSGSAVGGFAGFGGNWALPDSVVMRWPTASSPSVTAKGGAITAIGQYTLSIDFSDADFPGGYTGVSENDAHNLIAVYSADGVEDAFFPVRDKIGLVIAATADNIDSKLDPFIRENNGADAFDYLMIFLSEPYGVSSDWVGTPALLVTNTPTWSGDMAIGGAAVVVEDVTIDGTGRYNIVLQRGQITAGDWIRINPQANITDIAGNRVNDGNRWVQVHLQEVPPNVVNSYYIDNNADGRIDKINIVFDKGVKVSDISKFTFDFGAGVTGEIADIAGCDCAVASLSDNLITVDLAAAGVFSASADVKTGGQLFAAVTFAPDNGWGILNFSVIDKVAPVVVSAQFKTGGVRFGDMTPDTLFVTYSEMLSEVSLSVPTPVQILTNAGVWQMPTLQLSHSVADGNYLFVAYIVVDHGGYVPNDKDLVRINPHAGMSDILGNVQDNPNNRTPSLEVDDVDVSKPRYTVMFNSRGGSHVAPLFDVVSGSVISAPYPAPVMNGYILDGWYRDAQGVDAWDFNSDIVTSDITLYAIWTPVVKVYFYYDALTVYDSVSVPSGGMIDAPLLPPVRAGFTFSGWYKDIYFDEKWDFYNDTVSADTKLYAKWTLDAIPTFTVTFMASRQSGALPYEVIEVALGEKIDAPARPDSAGFVFLGWDRDDGDGRQWNFQEDIMPGRAVTLHARWRRGWNCGVTYGAVVADTTGGTLTISGAGRMQNYTSVGTPWFSCGASIQKAVVENGVLSIGDNTFSGAVNMVSVSIPVSVVSVGRNIFRDNAALKMVIVTAAPPEALESSFTKEQKDSISVYVPMGYIEDYRKAAVWKEFKNLKVLWGLPEDLMTSASSGQGSASVIAPPSGGAVLKVAAGPNPVERGGVVGFFVGETAKITGRLTIYDAQGNVVRKININNVETRHALSLRDNDNPRAIATWNLRDAKGRAVPAGTYLARGIVTVNGKRERVSVVVGVR